MIQYCLLVGNMKVQYSQGRYSITIPAVIMEALEWEVGTDLSFFVKSESIIYRRSVEDILAKEEY